MIVLHATGRLAEQPEVTLYGNTRVCKFRLLSTRFAQGKEHTEAVNFVCFNDEAERFAELTVKGQVIEATGTQQTHLYDASDGSGKRSFVSYALCAWQAGPKPRPKTDGAQGGYGGHAPERGNWQRQQGGERQAPRQHQPQRSQLSAASGGHRAEGSFGPSNDDYEFDGVLDGAGQGIM